jgi:hypothetical protein
MNLPPRLLGLFRDSKAMLAYIEQVNLTTIIKQRCLLIEQFLLPLRCAQSK